MTGQRSPSSHAEPQHRARSGVAAELRTRALSTVTPTGPRARQDHGAIFREWLAGPEYPDAVVVDGRSMPTTCFLGGLATSTTVLPAAAAARLGLPAGTPLGQAATDLILAVDDPAGPRCGSYRSAVLYLRAMFREPGVPDAEDTAAIEEASLDCATDRFDDLTSGVVHEARTLLSKALDTRGTDTTEAP